MTLTSFCLEHFRSDVTLKSFLITSFSARCHIWELLVFGHFGINVKLMTLIINQPKGTMFSSSVNLFFPNCDHTRNVPKLSSQDYCAWPVPLTSSCEQFTLSVVIRTATWNRAVDLSYAACVPVPAFLFASQQNCRLQFLLSSIIGDAWELMLNARRGSSEGLCVSCWWPSCRRVFCVVSLGANGIFVSV